MKRFFSRIFLPNLIVFFHIHNVNSEFYKVSNVIPNQNASYFYSGSLSKIHCLSKCNLIDYCLNAVFIRSVKWCLLYGKIIPNSFVDSSNSIMFTKTSKPNDKLVSYWPVLNNDLTDYAAQANMFNCINQTFVEDRFGNPNSAVYLNDGYCQLPTGVYFYNNYFTIMAWVKLIQIRSGSKILDFGPLSPNYEVKFSIFRAMMPTPDFGIFSPSATVSEITTTKQLNLSQWTHIAVVNTNKVLSMYFNGQFVTSKILTSTLLVSNRSQNYLGRSIGGNPNANAYFDEIKIFNSSLTVDQILLEMNNF